MAEPTVNQLVATTLANYHKELADNVSNSNAVTALLRQGNRIRTVDGGRSINCPLVYAEETFAWYMGTELLSRAVKETISEADYEPANAVSSVTLSGPDLAKNKGKERILNLLESKIQNMEVTMKNNITKAIYGDGTVAKSFAGLKAFITNDGSGTVGGIDASVWTFWKNQFQTATRQTGVLVYADLKAAMNALWLKLIRGSEHPDLFVVDGEVYSTYEGGLQEMQRYADASLGALGFETLKYKSASLVFDGAATGISGGYLMNTKYMKFEVYEGRNFEKLDLPDSSVDMDAITNHIGFMGGLTMNNRSMQGRLIIA
jgi:hypothetical protein